MGRWLTGLFGSQGKQKSAPITGFRVQSSVYGQPIPILVAGQQRMASNLLRLGNLYYETDSSAGALGGKGGMFSGGSNAGASNYYYADIEFGICEGPIAAIEGIWPRGKARSLSGWAQSYDTTAVTVAATAFVGDYTQVPWGYLEGRNPAQALAYRGIAHVDVASYPLGQGAILPNVNWEVRALNSYALGGAPGTLGGPPTSIGGNPDGDPSIAVSDWLTNPFWGVPGWPAARLGSLQLYQSYCLANALLVSPVAAAPVSASSFLIDLFAATNSAPRWSGGKLEVVPYGDQPIAVGQTLQATENHIIPPGSTHKITVNNAPTFVANVQVSNTGTGLVFTQVPWGAGILPHHYSVQNGVYKFNENDVNIGITIVYTWAAVASYVPQTQPIYSLTRDNFLPNPGGSGVSPQNSPLVIIRKPKDAMLTSVRVEYLDRGYFYNPAVIEIKDEAAINLYKRTRPGDVRQMHMICLASVASFSCTQLLIRANIQRTYYFRLGKAFFLLDPMDCVLVTDEAQNIYDAQVRITEITENDDGSLSFVAEDFPGTAQAPLYGIEAPGGYSPGNDIDPGNVNPPIIFEPSLELLNGATQEIWCGVSGGPNWGGCFVWVSTDGGINYVRLPGKFAGPSRMGRTTSALPAVPVNQVGETIDTTTLLGVDLSESFGTLLSASSAQDAQNLVTKCLVGNEIIAYQTANLTAQYKYNLSYLVRGAYGTESFIPGGQPAGAPFLRLDNGVFTFPFENSLIGKTLFIKFQSFNLYGEALQTLAAVGAYQFTVTSLANSSPLPTVQNVTSTTVDGRLAMAWDEIGAADTRNGIFYEIRAGATFDGAMTLGIVAHPPFVLPAGSNTYWITGWVQPSPGLIVRSEFPVQFVATNVQVTTNVIASYDEKALGWPGTFTSGAGIDTGLNAVRTGGTGDILTGAVLATISSGTYNSGTGLVTLVLSSAHGLTPGESAIIANSTGTGSFASINGTVVAGTGTTGTTLTYTISTGLTMTITGGQYIDADVINQGGEVSGIYTPGQIIDIGRSDTCPIYIGTVGTGIGITANILADANILTDLDILGTASAIYVNVYPEIAYGLTNPPTNWQKFAPGKFTGRYFQVRWQLQTSDPNTIAYLLAASWAVDVPDRVDHPLVNGILAAAGLAITFQPDNAASPAAFNGGPGGSATPAVEVTWSGTGADGAAAGDFVSITGLTSSGCTVQIKDSGGTARQRSQVSITVVGW